MDAGVNQAGIKRLRSFLEGVWPDGSSRGQCVRSTAFAWKLLGGKVAAGFREDAAGYRDRLGQWHYHFWLVKNRHIIDLTSDQFSGGSRARCVPIGDPRYRVSGSRSEIAQKLDDVLWSGSPVNQWVVSYLRGA